MSFVRGFSSSVGALVGPIWGHRGGAFGALRGPSWGIFSACLGFEGPGKDPRPPQEFQEGPGGGPKRGLGRSWPISRRNLDPNTPPRSHQEASQEGPRNGLNDERAKNQKYASRVGGSVIFAYRRGASGARNRFENTSKTSVDLHIDFETGKISPERGPDGSKRGRRGSGSLASLRGEI